MLIATHDMCSKVYTHATDAWCKLRLACVLICDMAVSYIQNMLESIYKWDDIPRVVVMTK